MTLEAIGAIGAPEQLLPQAASPAAGAGFGDWFAQQIGTVNSTIVNSENDIRKLASGDAQSLHEVMIHMEEAKLSLQLLAQVRNRVLEAYQEVMRMQV